MRAHWHDSSTLSLVVVLLAVTLLWLFCPQEFIGSDPSAYSQRAFHISESGDFGTGDVFNQRLAVTASTALVYKILGVNIRTTNLIPLLSALLITLTVWLALPRGRSRIIGAAFCLTSVPLLKSSVVLLPDVMAAAFMASSFYMLLQRERVTNPDLRWAALCFPLGAVGLLFVAFLAKLSAYWAIPLWIWAFLVDRKSKERAVLARRFYLPAVIAGLCLGAGYLAFCTLIWDDPLARLKANEALTGKHLWAWGNGSAGDMLKRLTISPVRLLISQYGVTILVLAFVAPFIAPRSVRPWSYYGLSCLLLFWFGTTSFSRYEPIALVERMTLPLLPALIILATYVASRLSVSADRPAWIKSIPLIVVFTLIGIPFAKHLNGWRSVELREAQAMSILQREVSRTPSQEFLLLCSDVRSPRTLSFYFGYRYPDNLRVTAVGELGRDFQAGDRTIVYVDRNRSAFLNKAYGRRHYDAEIDALDLASLYTSGSVALLEIENEQQMTRLIQSTERMDSGK